MSRKLNYYGSYASSSIVLDGLIQWLKGGQNVVGNKWIDQSGNNNDANLFGTPIVNSDNINLDGVDNLVRLNTGLISGDSTLTIRFKLNALAPAFGIYSPYMGSATNFGDSVQSSGAYRLWNGSYTATSLVFNTSSIYELTLVRTSTNITVYLDGVLSDVITKVYNVFDLTIGGKYVNTFNNFAKMDVYRFLRYNRALTASEILQNYNT